MLKIVCKQFCHQRRINFVNKSASLSEADV
jgi:hypothetical protein